MNEGISKQNKEHRLTEEVKENSGRVRESGTRGNCRRKQGPDHHTGYGKTSFVYSKSFRLLPLKSLSS